jgi:hypothetical protein
MTGTRRPSRELPGEPVPGVGFIVTNLSRPAERGVAFYDQRGKAEQFVKEGKNAIKWTRLSWRKFALPKEVEHWLAQVPVPRKLTAR